MAIQIAMEFAGDQVILRRLERIRHNTLDLRPAFEGIAQLVARTEVEQFRSQGSSGASGRWAPLAPSTVKWKAKRYPGKPILQATGELMAQATRQKGGRFGVERFTATSMEIGVNLAYAWYHQHGTPRMPQRKVISLTEARKRAAIKIAQRFWMTGVVT